MKLCSKCNEEKELKEFYKRTQRKDGYAAWCKSCANDYSKDRLKAWRLNTKLKLIDHFGGKCLDCGGTYPLYVMDFDHRDPNAKEFSVSSSKVANWDLILKEASKCDLVCANCHRVRTHIQRCSGCDECSSRP